MRDARVWLLALAFSGVAAFAAWVLKPSPRPAAGSRVNFIVDLPPNAQLRGLGDPTLAFSPDGRQLVYSAVVDGADRLFVRPLDNIESKPMVASEKATMPFFSPDGRWVGYSADRMLKRTPLGGGPALVIVQASATGATWGPEDRVVFAPQGRTGLSQVSMAGGAVSQLTTPERQDGETSHRWPEFLPGGRAVMFTAGPPPEGPWYDAQIVAQSLATGERHVLIRGAAQAHYVSTGHLVYARAGTLFAVPFDAAELRVGGPAIRVLEGVQEDQSQGTSQFTVSASGALAYVNGGLRASEVIWVDRQGNTESFITPKEPRIFYQPRLSPDGRRLALLIASGNDDVWVYDVAQKVLGRFTSGANHGVPAWTPDGKRITFTRSESSQILLQSADRSGPEEAILEHDSSQIPHCWSPDGRLMFFTQSSSKTGSDIWTLNIEDRKKQPVVVSPFNDRTPAISPSGQLLAYASDESGRPEVYVQLFPGGGGREQISREGGTEPLWARNGKELFFRQGTKLMVAEIGAGTSFGSPHPLFDAPWMTNVSSRTNYDISLNGQRFVAVRSIEPGSVPRIHVVLNWADELKRQVPK